MTTVAGVRPLARRAPGLLRLPPRVALFQARAMALATRLDDGFALSAATRPGDLASLLRVAGDARVVVELGTATGWTTAAFALASGSRQVVSFDPVVQPNRAAYMDLLPASARSRIRFVQAVGAAGPSAISEPVDLLFIDSTHERDDTVAEFHAWRSQVAPGATVVFHDFGNPAFPGVEEAVGELGLDGEERAGMYVWHAPR
jgi:predicted O-methyltransferase YrrM